MTYPEKMTNKIWETILLTSLPDFVKGVPDADLDIIQEKYADLLYREFLPMIRQTASCYTPETMGQLMSVLKVHQTSFDDLSLCGKKRILHIA